MPHHHFVTPKKIAAAKRKAASPSKEVEEEITGKKKGKRDYSILGRIMKGYKSIRKLGKKKKKDNPGHSY